VLILNSGSILGVLATFGVAVSAMTASEGHVDDSHSIERACAGEPTTRELEDMLSTARALSNDGSDFICGFDGRGLR
jgi:hypothetical protein